MNKFCEIKETNVVCAHKFSWFAKKVVCTTYDVLGILPLILGAIFDEIRFSANLKWQSFLHLFIKKNTESMNNFYNIKETKCCMCT